MDKLRTDAGPLCTSSNLFLTDTFHPTERASKECVSFRMDFAHIVSKSNGEGSRSVCMNSGRLPMGHSIDLSSCYQRQNATNAKDALLCGK